MLHTDSFSFQSITDKQETRDLPKLFLRDDSPETKYEFGRFKTTFHGGQLKLHLTEVYFLSKYAKEGDYVVYVGAAHFIHGLALFEMFPGLNWLLIDPGNFDKNIKQSENVRIVNKYFTDKSAKNIGKTLNSVLFISDIRTSAKEEEVAENMKAQMKWVKIIKPKAYMLKFRLSWVKNKLNYLDGDVLVQCCAPTKSTETRLIGTEWNRMKEWDCNKYQNQMMYHNMITRVKKYKVYENIKKQIIGMDNCWDCTAFIMIIRYYLINWKGYEIIEDDDVMNYVNLSIIKSLRTNMKNKYYIYLSKHLLRGNKYDYVEYIAKIMKELKKNKIAKKNLKPLYKLFNK